MNETIIFFEYSFLATFVLLISAGIGSYFTMGPKTISFVQHLTAGVVFAAVATELVPELLKVHSPFHIAIGFSLGVSLMVFIKLLTQQVETSSQSSWGILLGVGIDLFIDGILIALAFLSGEKTGKLITLALVLEVMFLALSLSTDLAQQKKTVFFRSVAFCIFSLLIPLGTASGILILNFLPSIFLTAALAFGAAALLYLVTEELLIEAHKIKDTPLTTISFFLGFLIILILKN